MPGSPRILVGTSEIARIAFNLTKGFRKLGLEADSLVADTNRHRFYGDAEYTITSMEHLEGVTYRVRPDGVVVAQPGRKFMALVDRYDIFVFIASTSLLPRLVDLPLLKKMGKTIISRQCGTEVRDTELAKVFWDEYGFEYPFYHSDKATPRVRSSTMECLVRLSRYHPALANKTHNTRMGEMYADAISCASPHQTLGIKPFFQSGPVFDPEEFVCRIHRRRRPLIVHAPSSKEYKRTDVVLKALEELREEGLPFELALLHEVPHAKVREMLTEADILIDDLSCGSGILAYEAAASGCAVLGGHDSRATALPRNRPILLTTEHNIKERVKQVIQDVAYRCQLAEKGRAFIEAGIGSPASVAEYLLHAIERAKQGDADVYPLLFTEAGTLPPGESMPFYLKEMTLEVMKRCGVHPDTDLNRLAATGLLPKGCQAELEQVPLWDTAGLKRESRWVLTGPNATYGMPDPLLPCASDQPMHGHAA